MSPVLIELGPFTIRYYGLMYVVAVLVGVYILKREVKRAGLPLTPDDVMNFALLAMLLGILGGRIYYVAFNWDYYGRRMVEVSAAWRGAFYELVGIPWLAQLLYLIDAVVGFFAGVLELLAVWRGGLAIHGGLIGGVVAGVLFARKKGIPLWSFADLVAPTVILGQAFGRFGNFMNGDAHGVPTTMPWGVVFPPGSIAGREFPGRPLHPAMLYELAWNLIVFGVLWKLRLRPHREGFIASLYLILYSAGRAFVESFRADSLMLGPLRAAQLASVLLAALGLFFILRGRLWEAGRGGRA